MAEAALEGASEILGEADGAWREVETAEGRVNALSTPGPVWLLMESAKRPRDRLVSVVLGLFGAGLFFLPWFQSQPDVQRQIWITAAWAGGALLCLGPLLRFLILYLPADWPRVRLRKLHARSPEIRLFAVGLLGYALVAERYSSGRAAFTSEQFLVSAGLFLLTVVAIFLGARNAFGRDRLNRWRVARGRLEAARRDYERELRAGALRRLRQQLGAMGHRSAYGLALTYRDHSGLAEIDDTAHEVPTRSKESLLKAMGRMPGGTIGISGSRGAGKTTLLQALCKGEGSRKKDRPPLGVVVDAPSRYEARDFILHLFARVCGEVIGPDQLRALRGSDRPFGYGLPGRMVLTQSWFLFGLVAVLGGAVLTAAAAMEAVDLFAEPLIWGLALLLVGWGSIALQQVSEQQRRRRLDSGVGQVDSSDPNVHTAILRLRQIWFQQSFSSGWSGGFKAPVGIEGGIEVSTELAEQQLSLPDVVDLFREFLREVASVREVRIGIDELDKMEDDDARRFLNEIKVVFRIPDCFFLISISEDAMSFFERRGLPIRDVFDSSFDDVFYVPRLPFSVSRELLERRIVELPQPFACLLHCLSGGLPRDLIRAARDLVELRRGTSLNHAAALMLGDALAAKAAAARVAARAFRDEDQVTVLFGWLEQLQGVRLNAPAMLKICERFEDDFLGELMRLPPDQAQAEERRELQILATQLAAYAYFAATMMQYFSRFEAPGFVDAAVSEVGGEPPVDRLAAVAQAFAADLNTAWAALTRFRLALDLGPVVEFPRARPVAGVVGGETADVARS